MEPLHRYFSILEGSALPMFMLARSVPVEVELSAPTERLWEEHDEALSRVIEEGREGERAEGASLLDLKCELARRMLGACEFCERRCRVNRHGHAGWCGVGETSYVSSEFLHMGEEWELVPSHTIFFCGCTFECVYCQNWEISQYPEAGVPLSPSKLAERIRTRYAQGSKNVNFVTPTPHVHTILETLLHLDVPVPVVWNSNMYHSTEVARLLDGVVDVYLGDLKYGNDACAKRLSHVERYWEVVSRNFVHASRMGELLIRQLVLPSHVECCTRPIVEWVEEHLPNALFNLMFQYHPEYRAREYPEIARELVEGEMKRALLLAERLRWLH